MKQAGSRGLPPTGRALNLGKPRCLCWHNPEPDPSSPTSSPSDKPPHGYCLQIPTTTCQSNNRHKTNPIHLTHSPLCPPLIFPLPSRLSPHTPSRAHKARPHRWQAWRPPALRHTSIQALPSSAHACRLFLQSRSLSRPTESEPGDHPQEELVG
jgi:hypothetical protein